MKRMLTILLTIVLCLTTCLPSTPLHAETVTRVVNNLVLFAQFESEDGYNFMDTERTELLLNGCNSTDTIASLHSYIDAISYGQMQADCYFPQMENGVIQPYTMAQALEAYDRETLCREILEHVTIPEDMPLDGDNDGEIDNVIFVIDGEANAYEDILWPHASMLSYLDIELNGKTVNHYNLHNSGQLFTGLDTTPFDAVVLCHEFLHTLGYPDLYHKEDNYGANMPVSAMWDIMAAGGCSDDMVSPLAYMRASRSGWLETTSITEDGTYTLAPALSDSGNRVYLLKTPLSETEFFAVEYRRKGAYGELDWNCESGMLIYRVNTNFAGNTLGGDEIYIFRPMDTGLLGNANYGGTNDDCIGSLDPEDGLEDGALTYSDGTNSGIRIENITMDGDTLTFDVQFAELDLDGQWKYAEHNLVLDWPGCYDLAASDSGEVYLAGTSTGGKAVSLYRVSDSWHLDALPMDWTPDTVRLAAVGDTLYLLCSIWSGQAALYEFADGVWQTLWQAEAGIGSTDLCAEGGQLYLTYTEEEQLLVFRYADGQLTKLGNTVCESALTPLITCTEGLVGVAYRDMTDGLLPKLAVWDGTDWTYTTLSDQSDSVRGIDSYGGTITAALGSDLFCQYRDGAVTELAFPALEGDALTVLPLYADGTLLAAIYTQSDYHYAVYAYTGGGWEMVGKALEAGVSLHRPVITASGNTIYTGYQFGTGQSGIDPIFLRTLQYDGVTGTVSGDVNADGAFSVLDVAMLQKWLLGAGEITDCQAGDLCEDGRIDVFDLCIMKRALLNQ